MNIEEQKAFYPKPNGFGDNGSQYKRNRSDKRAITQELQRNWPFVVELENAFLSDLQVDSPQDDDRGCFWATYKQIYDQYLEKWEELSRWMIRTKRLRYTHMNKGYFVALYRPLEQEPPIFDSPLLMERPLIKGIYEAHQDQAIPLDCSNHAPEGFNKLKSKSYESEKVL